jgi:hypothetical protein
MRNGLPPFADRAESDENKNVVDVGFSFATI